MNVVGFEDHKDLSAAQAERPGKSYDTSFDVRVMLVL
jgi:hypothetical protein